MNRLRTHIIRLIVILLVCSGFGLSLAQPAQAKRSTSAFADWLSTMTKSANGADLEKELNNLRQSGDHLDKVIEKASQLVSKNNDEFTFSYAESMASQQLYQLLLIEWNQFQTGNAMSSIPTQQVAKSLVPVKTHESSLFGSVVPTRKSVNKIKHPGRKVISPGSTFLVSLIPMVGGIAIGAP